MEALSCSNLGNGKPCFLAFMWMLLWHVPPTDCCRPQRPLQWCSLMATASFTSTMQPATLQKIFRNGLRKITKAAFTLQVLMPIPIFFGYIWQNLYCYIYFKSDSYQIFIHLVKQPMVEILTLNQGCHVCKTKTAQLLIKTITFFSVVSPYFR